MADDKIKFGVLWTNVSREGNKRYLSGRVEHDNIDAAVALLSRGGRLLILSSKKRPDKRDPDCVLFVVPEKSQSAEADGGRVDPSRRPAPTPSTARSG